MVLIMLSPVEVQSSTRYQKGWRVNATYYYVVGETSEQHTQTSKAVSSTSISTWKNCGKGLFSCARTLATAVEDFLYVRTCLVWLQDTLQYGTVDCNIFWLVRTLYRAIMYQCHNVTRIVTFTWKDTNSHDRVSSHWWALRRTVRTYVPALA